MGQTNRLTGRVTQNQDQTVLTARNAAAAAAGLVSGFYDNLGRDMPEETKRALTEQFSAPLFAEIAKGFGQGIQRNQAKTQGG